ncbi:MAG: SUMF1/EgtB/PvdO family nonheme iron enzyme, partial [Kiritimatiellia bacterium]|nr:SUMF1/EgtB/PvdO family nonheme iron enzyme [Kiritimatiellia bacterium]
MRTFGGWRYFWAGLLLAAAGIGFTRDPDAEYFRIVSPSDTVITGIDSDGAITWSNSVLGATGRVQRASTLTGGGNWSDAHQYRAARAAMSTAASRNYLVLDLTDGPGAEAYPIQFLAGPPEGGWTAEYKTTKLVLRRMAAGNFEIGSPESELGRDPGEILREVELTRDYYIGVFPVTQKQWERVMNAWPA